MSQITKIDAREILDSRGKPTLEVSVYVDEYCGTFSVPSGASTGSTEAFVVRDEDGHMRAAIAHVQTIAASLLGMDVFEQEMIDRTLCELDGTEQKSHLGGNVMLGVSVAAARCAAQVRGIELFEYLRSLCEIAPSRSVPLLYMNYINGGKHVDPAHTSIAIQEHMIVPQTDSVEEALSMAVRIEKSLQQLILDRYGSDTVGRMGDEGGFVIPESDPEIPLQILSQAIEAASLTGLVRIALDAAANSFYEHGTYYLRPHHAYTSEELCTQYESLASKFDVISIEDPFAESDRASFASLLTRVANRDIRIVGDDITTTARARIEEAANEHLISAVIIKPNQVGTLTETLEAMHAAREHGIECIVSHRSGETLDTFVADLAYAFGTFGLKAGALRKIERRTKYERLQAIAHSFPL